MDPCRSLPTLLRIFVLLLLLWALPATAWDPSPAPTAPRIVTLEREGLPPIEFVRVPPGSFLMGTSPDDVGAKDNPRWFQEPFPVEMTQGVWMARTETTEELWHAVMGTSVDPALATFPVRSITPEQVDDFLERLRKRVGEDVTLRLPTEVEWERAARAGGDRSLVENIRELGWTRADGIDGPQPVATKQPNAWGIHDLFGNVNELCADRFASYPATWSVDWIGRGTEGLRSIRGGSYTGRVRHANPSDRAPLSRVEKRPWVGFRLAAEGLEATIPREPLPLDVAVIGERVRVYRPDLPIGNPTTIALLGDDETWLLDANVPQGAAAIAADLEALGAAPVTRVITTHAHRDHVDGLIFWTERGASTVATPQQATVMATSPLIEAAIAEGRDPRPPTALVHDAVLSLVIEGTSIDVHVRRPASRSGHTDGDLVVHVPAFDLLYVGDLFFLDRFPIVGVAQRGSLEGTLADHRWIAETFPPSSTVVPGHNRFFPDRVALPSMDEFVAWSRRIRSSVERIDAAVADGVVVEDLIARGLEVDLIGLTARPRYVPGARWIEGVAQR